jgi:hypothetical protein
MKSLVLSVLLGPVLMTGACKTTAHSTAQSVPFSAAGMMTLEEWTAACQKELSNPKTGKKSKAELLRVANTVDCAAAYPTVRQILERSYKQSQ